LRRVRDFAHVKGCEVIDADVAARGLDMMDVDANGLDQMDRKILTCIISHFSGGPVGVKTIAVACSEEVRTIEEIYEPYLIQSGLLKRTPRGRVVTKKAYTHLGLPFV
jgi:Holliday junction DNA helicase RuvB